MNRTCTILMILMVLTVITSSLTVSGQTSRKRAPAKSPAPVFKFNPDVIRLPANYQGDDINKIVERVKNIHTQRDEFETTEEYNARLLRGNAELSLQIVALRLKRSTTNLETSSRPLNVKTKESGPDVKYSADDRRLTIQIPCEGSTNILAKEHSLVTKSEATTRMGVKFDVLNVLISRDYIGVKAPDGFRHDGSITFSISDLEPARAATLKPQLAVLLVGRVKTKGTENPVETDLSESNASLDSPMRRTSMETRLDFELREIWIFNSSTGEIIESRKYVQQPSSRGR